MTIEYHVVRDAGHPWDGRPGWDHLHIEASTEAEMDAAVLKAKAKFWQCWLIGQNEKTGVPGGVMYKPSGSKAPWQDVPLPAIERYTTKSD